MCRVCPLCDTVPPDRFYRFPFTSGMLGERPQIHLVVAHYRENLNWLADFATLPQTIYSKGSPAGPNALPNVGREAHTYLHHIANHYDTLAELTVFLQGNPLEHVPDLFEKICSLDALTQYKDLGDDVLVEDGNGFPPQPGLPLASFYSKLFDQPPPDYYSCRAGACFAVSRDCIRLRPRSFYQHALELVVTERQGAWAIERLWPSIFVRSSRTAGVVTAADAGFFRELQFLVRSLAEFSGHPLCVIDLGLTPEQRDWCLNREGVVLWQPSRLFAPARRIYERYWWQAWTKPFHIEHAPYDQVLWIDADCVVLQPIDELFSIIKQQPLLIRDATTASTENDPRLYEYLRLPAGTRTVGINVNSGVVGLCRFRDHRLLNAWLFAAQYLAIRLDLQPLSAWADQGLLLFSILQNGLQNLICRDIRSNQPAFVQKELLSDAVRNGISLLHELQRRFPDSTILHFLGPHKLSRQLDAQMEDIFVSHGLKDLPN